MSAKLMHQENNSAEMSPEMTKLIQSRDELRSRIKDRIIFSDPIISRLKHGIIYGNTINVIQGKAGSHKSRLMEIWCACILAVDNMLNYVGFQRYSKAPVFTLLYVDTERNTKDQLPYALQTIVRKAGFAIDQPPNNFDFVSMVETPREDRLKVLQEYISMMREHEAGHIIIVLDVITDLVSNFNDPKESMQLIDYMNSLINTQDVTFLCVIHENPSQGEKARGHLGTEIMNKASLQMQIGFEKTKNQEDTDLIKVKYLKTRVGKRPEPFHLVYSDSQKSLVFADPDYISGIIDKKRHVAYLDEVIDRLMTILKKPLTRAELVADLTEFFDCSKNTVLDRLNEINAKQMSIKGKDGTLYILDKSKIGRETSYALILKTEKLISDESKSKAV